jgi:hypothetical protein
MEVRRRIEQYVTQEGISKSDAMKKLAKELACSKREIYRLLIEDASSG